MCRDRHRLACSLVDLQRADADILAKRPGTSPANRSTRTCRILVTEDHGTDGADRVRTTYAAIPLSEPAFFKESP